MFCKKCGKLIPDDSLFCQYCGEQLSGTVSPDKKERKSVLSRFQSLSKGWQICLMAYVCWVFLWVVFSIEWVSNEPEEALTCILFFVVILPVLALFVWYYFTHLKRKKKEPQESPHNLLQSKKEQIPSGYSVYPLLQFAKAFGKMQIRVERDGDDIKSSCCTFTNEEGVITQVSFSETTSGMTATDVSENKDRLFIIHTPESGYQLVKL